MLKADWFDVVTCLRKDMVPTSIQIYHLGFKNASYFCMFRLINIDVVGRGL